MGKKSSGNVGGSGDLSLRLPIYFKQAVEEEYEAISLDEHVSLYCSSKGNTTFVKGIPPRLMEYYKLTFFWEKFGINKFELEKCDNEWIQQMYLVGIAVDKFKNSNNQGSVGQTPVANRTFKGPTKKEKLL